MDEIKSSAPAHPAKPTDTDHQQRGCRSCHGAGWVLADAEYNPATGELVQESTRCFICGGAGWVSVLLYRRSV